MSIYSKEFKEEAIRLSDEMGNKKAAAQLGIPYYTLADWRNHSKHKPKETMTLSDEELRARNRELERENAELREANNILKDALGFFARDRKKYSMFCKALSSTVAGRCKARSYREPSVSSDCS